MEEFWRNTVDQAQTYGPQLLKAALVMIAFIIGAFIVRWLIAAAIDRTGLAKKANESTATSDSKSLGTSLAQADRPDAGACHRRCNTDFQRLAWGY